MDCADSCSSRSMSASLPYILPPSCSYIRSSSTSPSRPRRRASQGAVSTHRTQPSWPRLVASKDKPLLQLPPLTTIWSPPSLPAMADPSSMSAQHATLPLDAQHSDLRRSLPLTPPADDEHDGPGRWAVQRIEPSKIAMDESRDRHSASPSHHQTDGRGFNPPARRSLSDDDVNMLDQDIYEQPSPDMWLNNSIKTVLASLLESNTNLDPVRLISQTLPYPRAANRNVRLPTDNSVFCHIIENIQDQVRPERPPYIHVMHAVPEDFNMSNLPTSPPSTPGHMMDMDSYFDSTVFASASPVPAYHEVHGTARPVNWPHPIVPPYSIHVSVLERYIPPSTQCEYRDLFRYGRPSVLTDRLLELSPLGGCLLFIYPTRVGATTFKSQYLGPILDPLLRQLVVVNGFSADVSRELGRMEAVNAMDDFETMKTNLENLCQKLSKPATKFTIVEAGKGRAPLDRQLWTEWYIQQERPRMKSLLSRSWQTSGGRHTPMLNSPETGSGQLSSAMLLSEIIEGIKRRQYETSPKGDIELGVFVIRRSH